MYGTNAIKLKFFAIVILLLELIYSYKCLFNQWLDKSKFTSVKICAAKNYNSCTKTYTNPCEKYSHRKYCSLHSKELAKACKQYHYISHLSHDDPLLHYWAQRELDERIEFCQRFSISTDYGHAKWNKHLRSIINRHEQQLILHEQIKKERRLQRLDHIFEDSVNSKEIKECAMTLFYADNYEINKKEGWQIDENWSDSSILKNENQFDKLIFNYYLFQNYFKRSNLSEMNYLNLFETKRKMVEDEWKETY